MPRVSIQYITKFMAESPTIVGETFKVRKVINDMFDALERYEREKDIQLEDIKLSTIYESEDYEEVQLVKYYINAEYTKHEAV